MPRMKNNYRVPYKSNIYNVRMVEDNTFSFKNLFLTIISVLIVSSLLVYLFNYKEFNNAWWTIIFFDVLIFSLKDFLYSSLFVSIITFVIFIVFKRKI